MLAPAMHALVTGGRPSMAIVKEQPEGSLLDPQPARRVETSNSRCPLIISQRYAIEPAFFEGRLSGTVGPPAPSETCRMFLSQYGAASGTAAFGSTCPAA